MDSNLKDYKWLVASCLQKSIRRGRWDLAEQYIRFLWLHDRNYVTYRLGIILIEDMGIGNLPVLWSYLETKIAKKNIEEKGGLDFLLEVTKEACLSVKDRSSCDAAYACYYYHYAYDNGVPFSDIFLNEEEHYVTRIMAGWIALGNKKYKHDALPFLEHYLTNDKGREIDDLPTYLALVDKLCPSVHNIVENAYLTQTELICLGLPVVLSLYEKEKHIKTTPISVGSSIENILVPEETMFHSATKLPLISSGIDSHTREGKSACYQYLKMKTEFLDYLKHCKVPFEDYMTVLSHCLFRLEGHEVNKRLYFPSAVTIMRECEAPILQKKLQNNHIEYSAIKKFLLKDMPIINSLRRKQIH